MEIHANMLTDPRDLAALRRSMEITRELGNSEAMKPFVKREILPGDLEGEGPPGWKTFLDGHSD